MAAGKGKDLNTPDGAANVGHARRWKMKRAFRRMSQRIQNWTRDFHYRFAKWLCENYRVILLPHYQVGQMVLKVGKGGKRRCIASKTVRAMLNWSPCRFRDRLLAMSRRYPGCHVVQLSEAWTSKTCRGCGHLHHKLGGNHVFRCPSCSLTYSRDEGGACNILLRHATMLHDGKEDFLQHLLPPPPPPPSSVLPPSDQSPIVVAFSLPLPLPLRPATPAQQTLKEQIAHLFGPISSTMDGTDGDDESDEEEERPRPRLEPRSPDSPRLVAAMEAFIAGDYDALDRHSRNKYANNTNKKQTSVIFGSL